MLYLHHSNSLKKLGGILLDFIHSTEVSALKPEQILVQNPGMKRWLQQHISANCGIAANLEFPLPSRFIWDVFLTQFKDIDTLSAYDAEVLRWRLLDLLQSHRDDARFSMLNTYQKLDDRALASFQLAQKMASLFDQYLVYRPHMIRHWEQEKPLQDPTEAWQAELWRLLRQSSSEPHRAHMIKRLIDRLRRHQMDFDALPHRLFVFGISAMSPLYMDVLAMLGQHIDVHILNLNPCLHYWGDIQSRKEQIRQGQQPIVDNELLASMGKQGRDYFDQFYDCGVDYVENDAYVDSQPTNLLQRVKHDILTLSPSNTSQDFKQDNSIQVVSCYSELRELQVLHDRLLDMLQQDPGLQPHDIVIMCPDINTLSPYIEAVFGQQPGHRKIPFSISDQNQLTSSPLLQVLLQWIMLPGSRFSASEIMGWLELPALQRAYKLDPEQVEVIRHWVKNNHVHWGLNKAHKQQLNLGQEHINTWWHAISRLLNAYIMGTSTELYGRHIAAQTIITTSEFKLLGQLQKLLDDLARYAKILDKAMTLHEWQRCINEMIEQLLDLDDDEEWLIKPLRDEMSGWNLQAQQANFKQPVDAILVTQLLKQALSQGRAHHHYLAGGINFCNLIPMRTLPFKVVCLIGMGGQYFPRTEIPVQFDLIARNPRKGDRSRREDDRYMFLQSLLACESRFYISYVGQDKNDDSTIEPSVLVSELIDHIQQTTGHQLEIEQSTLHPFSVKNFVAGSYAEQWCIQPDQDIPHPFNQKIEDLESVSSLDLDEIIRFYKNPFRHFMRTRLNMSLDEYDEVIEDEENFTISPLQRSMLLNEMLQDRLQDQQSMDKYLYSGALVEQNFGLLQLTELNEKVERMHQALTANEHFKGLERIQHSIKVGNINLTANIPSYATRSLLQISPANISGRFLFSLWIQHCFLCAGQWSQGCDFYYKDASRDFFRHDKLDKLSVDEANAELENLLQGYLQGQQQLMPFFANTAYRYEKKKIEQGEQQGLELIKSLWEPGEYNNFYEAQDTYILTGLKNPVINHSHLPQEFFSLSSRFMLKAVSHQQGFKS